MDLFLLCIAARLALAYAATRPKLKTAVVVFLLSVATAWLAMTFGILKRDTGKEAGGGIWWKHLRFMHAINYLVAAFYLHRGDRVESAAVLVADVAVGSFLRYRHRNKNKG